MGKFDEVDATPRRTMVLFFIVDTSGSMKGEKIASLNTAVAEVMPYVDDISSKNPDAQIKIASLEFSSGCEWMYPQPMEPENYNWRDLEAGGLTDFGDACNELNSKLSKKNLCKTQSAHMPLPLFLCLMVSQLMITNMD